MPNQTRNDSVHLQNQEQKRKWLADKLSAYMAHGFWGKITIIMEDGKVRRFMEEKSVIPP